MKSFFPSFLLLFVLSLFSLPAFGQSLAPMGEKGFQIIGVSDVASVTVSNPGSGYTSAPSVAFSGGTGAGATATSRLKVVGSVTITAGGSGYTVGDVLTLTGGTKTTTATFTVSSVSTGAVTAVTITNAGVYTVPVTTTGAATTGAGTGCTVTLSWGVQGVVVSDGGEGYASAPTVSFSGGGGSSAAASATLTTIVAADVKFRAIIPITDTVIDEIETPSRIIGGYSGDETIEGVTLTAGKEYPVFGSSILLTSGVCLVVLR